MSTSIVITDDELDVLDDVLSYANLMNSLDPDAVFDEDEIKRQALRSLTDKVNRRREKQNAMVY